MTMRWMGTGRSSRGVPARRRLFRLRPLGLVLLAFAALAQTGCQSGFFGPCGANPCGSTITSPCNYLKGLRERIFSRRVAPMSVGVIGGGSCCGGSGAPIGGPVYSGSEAPLEYAPPAVVTPGVVPSLPSAPAEMPAPTELAPIPIEPERTPSATPEPSAGQSSSSGAKGTAGRASYEAARPRDQLSGLLGDQVARTMASTPEPALRSAQGTDPASEHWLENLPPLSIPRDETRNELPEPAPPAEELGVGSSAQPVAQADPEPPAPAEVSVAPGIRRFVAVEPKLSGGSLPTTAGLDWLVEKGYKTLLDLRETGEVQPSFIEEVANRGMRYVALPIGLTKVDAAHVERFNLEIALADARPLYFCDTDGVRSGTLWFIRRVTVDGIDAQAADQEAAELGLNDNDFRAAAMAYLQSLKPAQRPSAPSAPAPTPAAVDAEKPAPTVEPKPVTAPAPEPAPAPTTSMLPAGTITDLADPLPIESLKDIDFRDTTVLRSAAAMVVTGLGVPLAYWTRTSLPGLGLLKRASLPAPARQSKSLPPGSGE